MSEPGGPFSTHPPPLDSAKLSGARLRAVTLQPYLATALYALSPVSSPGLDTFAVDRTFRLFVDPVALDRWSVEEVAGVLLHEVGHVIRDHGGRALQHAVHDASSRLHWNLAADAELNDDLLAAQVSLPPVPVVPATLGEPAGRVVEYYFDRIVSRNLRLPALFHTNCGAGAHGFDEGVGLSAPGEPELHDFDVVLVRARVAAAIQSYPVGSGTGAGLAPTAGWRRWAAEQAQPQLPWRQLLRTAVRGSLAVTTGMGQPSYAKPARRRHPRVVLPALVRPLPSVAIIIDTSGSVDDAMLNSALDEVRGCLRQVGVRRDLLTLYATDTAAHRVTYADLRAHQLPGGGGTDLRVGLQAALTQRLKPHLVVVLTDGHTQWPQQPPSARVVVGLLPSGSPPADPPAWARTVVIR